MNQSIYLLIGLLLLVPVSKTVPHEPKDGEIVRSIQIIVRDDIAHVRVAVGANDKTLSELLDVTGQKAKSNSVDDQVVALHKSLPPYVIKHISLSLDDKLLTSGNIKIQQTAAHHERFVIEAKYKIGRADRFSRLVIKDQLFDKYPGAIRYAIRPRGRAIITNANVAPVLARAKPFQNEDVTKSGKSKTITAKLKILPKRDKTPE